MQDRAYFERMTKAQIIGWIERTRAHWDADTQSLKARLRNAEAYQETAKAVKLEALREDIKDLKSQLNDTESERDALVQRQDKTESMLFHPPHCHAAGVGQNLTCTCGLA